MPLRVEKEREEVERLRGLTEDERRAQLRLNPRTVTNKAPKGKYKFLQKYYHRGVFYMVREGGREGEGRRGRRGREGGREKGGR